MLRTIPASEIDVSKLRPTMFQRVNDAALWVLAFSQSDATMSDAGVFDAATRASLRTALCRMAGFEQVKRDTGKKTLPGKRSKGGKPIMLAVPYKSAQADDALRKLGWTLNTLADYPVGKGEKVLTLSRV